MSIPDPAAQRSARARLAALEKSAQTDGREATAKARAVYVASFEREIRERFPGLTDEAEIARRARALRKAHFVRLALIRWKKS